MPPPELMIGLPHAHSDQYCLAVSYCHLRTGILPLEAIRARWPSFATRKGNRIFPSSRTLASETSSSAARNTTRRSCWPSCQEMVRQLDLALKGHFATPPLSPRRPAARKVGTKVAWLAVCMGAMIAAYCAWPYVRGHLLPPPNYKQQFLAAQDDAQRQEIAHKWQEDLARRYAALQESGENAWKDEWSDADLTVADANLFDEAVNIFNLADTRHLNTTAIENCLEKLATVGASALPRWRPKSGTIAGRAASFLPPPRSAAIPVPGQAVGFPLPEHPLRHPAGRLLRDCQARGGHARFRLPGGDAQEEAARRLASPGPRARARQARESPPGSWAVRPGLRSLGLPARRVLVDRSVRQAQYALIHQQIAAWIQQYQFPGPDTDYARVLDEIPSGDADWVEASKAAP